MHKCMAVSGCPQVSLHMLAKEAAAGGTPLLTLQTTAAGRATRFYCAPSWNGLPSLCPLQTLLSLEGCRTARHTWGGQITDRPLTAGRATVLLVLILARLADFVSDQSVPAGQSHGLNLLLRRAGAAKKGRAEQVAYVLSPSPLKGTLAGVHAARGTPATERNPLESWRFAWLLPRG